MTTRVKKRYPGIPGTRKALDADVQKVLRSSAPADVRGRQAAALIEDKIRAAHRIPA